ncbi:MAG TPA: CoA transferase [Hyphomicrobiaceae bacterium]|jgi:formyl-CoA transferase
MRPLEGLRVVDLTRVLSGPYCTMQLGDMGAEVIKVEQPGKGDDTRAFAPPYQGDQAAYFLSVNRNKKSITLDMKSTAGKEVLWRLIDRSDILVENFRPGAMDRLGFGYAAVKKRRPAVVYASISGFGASGPQKDRPGYDVIVQGEAGIMDITGPGDGAPYKVGTAVADLVSGLYAVQGILAALYAARSTGRGQHVDISMYEAMASLLTFNAGIYFATGEAPRRRGNEHPTIVPYETFEAADGWINLGVANDDLWRRFCRAAEAPDLVDDPRFAKAADRVRNRKELVPLVRALVKQRPRDDWMQRLDKAGVPAGAIRTVGEVCDSGLLKGRGMVAEMEHTTAGVVKAVKNAVRLSATPLDAYAAPPQLGQHTREVLTGLLGYSQAEFEALARNGAV